MKYPCFCHPVKGFLPRGLFSWNLSFIIPSLLLLVILNALFLFGPGSRALADVTITVDAAQNQGFINPLVFGQNVLFDGNTMWDHRTDTLKAEADNSNVIVKNRIEELAPTILRFPGGNASNVHIWEDGLGIQTTEAVNNSSTTIVLGELPQSWRVPNAGTLKGLLIDAQAGQLPDECLKGQLGDDFDYGGIDNNILTGVGVVEKIDASHSPGARVRPGGRPLVIPPDPLLIWFTTDSYWTNTYGIIEHLKLVKSLGAQALLTVNYSTGLDGTGTITTNVSLSQRLMRAQALVAFCNGSISDNRSLGTDGENRNWNTVGYWAGQRAAMGYPEPFGVLYWEVGNELFFSFEPGHTTASEYAFNFNQFARKMKTIDPQIKVGAVGHNLPTCNGDDDPYTVPPYIVPWNATVVTNTINDLDFLVIHTYYPYIQSSMDYNSDPWFKLVMAGAIQAGNHLGDIRNIIDSKNVNHRNIALAVTEYGLLPTNGEAEHYSSLARALHDADLLMYLIKKEGSASKLGLLAAAAWDLHSSNNGAAIGYQWPGPPNNSLNYTESGLRTIRPQYYALKMLRQSLAGRQLLHTEVLSSPTFSIAAKVGNIDANPAIPCLEALGVLSSNGRRFTLAVINRSLDSFPNPTITATIQLNNLPFAPKSARITKLTSTNPGDNNEAGEIVKPSEPVTYAPVPQNFNFEPHSLTIIEFIPIPLLAVIDLLLLDD